MSLYYKWYLSQKMMKFDSRILWCHWIALIGIWNKTYWQWIRISNNYGVMAVFIATHCSWRALIPLLAVRFSLISSLIFWDRPGLPIYFLHISTRSIDWRNKTSVSLLSRFICNGTYFTWYLSQKWLKFEGRISWCHPIDLVGIRKWLTDNQYGSRLITQLWRFLSPHSTRQALWFRY